MLLHIDEATLSDIAALDGLFGEMDAAHRPLAPQIFKDPPARPFRPADRLRFAVEDDRTALLAARLEDRVVGLAYVSITEVRGHFMFADRTFAVLEDLVVRDGCRRQGIGTALVRQAERWAVAQGATSLQLMVWSANDGAQRFYERIGYAPTAIKMKRELTP